MDRWGGEAGRGRGRGPPGPSPPPARWGPPGPERHQQPDRWGGPIAPEAGRRDKWDKWTPLEGEVEFLIDTSFTVSSVVACNASVWERLWGCLLWHM